MNASDTAFDIFRIEKNGDLTRVETAPNLEAAKLRIDELGGVQPGDYLIFSIPSGDRIIIRSRPK